MTYRVTAAVRRMRWFLEQLVIFLASDGTIGLGGDPGEQGQSMVEYAIVVALIALVAMAAVQALGGGIVTAFNNILSKIQGL